MIVGKAFGIQYKILFDVILKLLFALRISFLNFWLKYYALKEKYTNH